jgi:hypothetical protein
MSEVIFHRSRGNAVWFGFCFSLEDEETKAASGAGAADADVAGAADAPRTDVR